MKTIFFLLFLGAVAYGAFLYIPSLITGSYQSVEYAVKFNYPSHFIVAESGDREALEIKKTRGVDALFISIEKYERRSALALTYRLAQEFGKVMQNESPVTMNGLPGIFFNWSGKNGLESAFAFESKDSDYVLTTNGMPDKDIKAAFDIMTKSISLFHQ